MKNRIITILILAAAILPTYAQKLIVQKGTVEMGQVAYDRPVTAEFDLKNKGLRKLKINDVKVSCGCINAEYPKGEISSGDNFKVKLTYDARQMGHFEKTACIYSNGSKEPVYLTMKGVVVEEVEDISGTYPFEYGDLRVDKNDLEFDDVNKGDQPVQVLHIRNTGTKQLQPNVMHLPPYLSATVTPEKLRPGNTGKITFTLNSSKLRDFGLTQTSVYLANNLGEKVSTDNEISVSAVLLPGFVGMTGSQKQYAAKLALSSDKLVLDFKEKDKAKGEITITNNGRTTLKISSLQMFTGGLRVTLGKQNIEPGETTTLKVNAVRNELQKARSKPRILMITNDPDRAKVVIEIKSHGTSRESCRI